MPIPIILINIALELVAREITQEKEIKVIQAGKKKIKLFADYTITYIWWISS